MTLGSHQRTIGRSQVAITPRGYVDETGPYDLDPCASDPRPYDCAAVNWTEADDGLSRDWFGRVWLNPPFDRRVVGLWIARMIRHGCGVALVHARTETNWFWPLWSTATAILFLRRRVQFLRPDGSPFVNAQGQPKDSGAPVVLAAFSRHDAEVLAGCRIEGKFVPLVIPASVLVRVLADRTWRDLVAEHVRVRGRASTDELFVIVSAHPKARGNRHVRAKLRQVLNGAGFERAAGGWRLAA